jgi:AbrB family looped-hinge helix DNA binding protein
MNWVRVILRENVIEGFCAMNSGFAEEQHAGLTGIPVSDGQGIAETAPLRAKLKIGPGGRVVIPAAIREKLGLNEGDALMATFENGELRLVSLVESVRQAQALVRGFVPAGVSLVDELLEDRRREVLKEQRGG